MIIINVIFFLTIARVRAIICVTQLSIYGQCFCVVKFVKNSGGIMMAGENYSSEGRAQVPVSEKSKAVAALLCFFVGLLGIHRFYVGKIGSGLLWMFTGGLLGIGAIVDFFVILFGSFTDKAGHFLK